MSRDFDEPVPLVDKSNIPLSFILKYDNQENFCSTTQV